MKFLLSFLLLAASLIPTFGQGQGKNTRYFNTVTDLLASNPNDANRAVWLLGLNSISDNLGGLWYWFPNSTTATNLTTVFQANSTTVGRWEKINLPNTADVDTSGFITNFTVITVRDIPSLKSLAVDRGIQAVIVRGYFDPNDKGEGTFVYDSTSAEPEDGGRVIAPNNGAGKWIRVVTPETIYATWFSPTVTNGTLRIAVDYAASAVKGTVILPGVDIYLDGTDPIYIPSRVTVMGQTGTRIIVSDNPSTNYVPFVLSGVEAAGVQNMAIIGWPSAPGDVANTGWAVAMTNCTNCVLGGITYTDFYSTPVFDGGGNAGNNNKFYGPQWEPNSIEGYGADRSGLTDSTAAIKFAMDNTGGPGSVMGGRILWPAGLWSCNIIVTNKNLIFEGESFGIDNTITNNKIMPWDVAQFAMTVGADFAGTSLSGSQQGIMLNNLRFDANGPNGLGVGGLHVKSGTYHAHVTDCSFYDGKDAAMLVDCGSNRENFYALFTRCQFQNGDTPSTNNAVRFASGISITTLAEFSGCEIHGANANGHALTVDSGLLLASGSTRVQCSSLHGVLIQKVTSPASNPKLYGNWNIDSDFSTDILVELPDNGPPVNYFVGNVDIDGRIKEGTGGITYIMKNSVLSVADYLPDALLTSASIYNNLYFQDQNSITNTGPTNSAYITGFNRALQIVNNKSGIYAIPNTYLYLYPTNGTPTMLYEGQGQYSTTLGITITNVPVTGATITVNGTTWTWSGATFLGSNIPTNATIAGSLANLYTQLTGTGFSGTWTYTTDTINTATATRWYYSLTNSVSAGWATITYVTNTTANDVFTSSISVPDSTNMAIQAANILYLNSTNGSRAVTIKPDGTNNAIIVNGFGVGVLRTPTGAHLEVDGRAGLGIEASISSARTYTNTSATTQAQIEAIQTLQAPSASATVSHTIYGAQLLSSAAVGNVTGLSFPFRSEWYHQGSQNVTAAGGYYVGDPAVSAGGTFTSFVGYRSELSSGNGKFAFVGNGTAPSRFNGDVGIGKVPAAALDVVANAAIGGTLSYGTNGGTSVVPVGVDSSGRLTTNSVSYFNLVGTAYRGGDQTGNAQGATALDVQSEHSTATKVASGSTSVAVGANNTASSTSSVALGGSNTASGTQAVAVGVQNTASGINNSSAIGNFNTASATGSTAIGYSAKSAVQFSINMGGQIFTRRDNAESHGGTSLPGDYNYFSGTEVIIWSGEVDLKTEIGYTNTIPSGVHFFPDEVGLVLTTANTVTGQPTVSFGVLGTLAKYLAATATSGLTANFDRQRFQTLLTAAGLSATDTMTVTISANATGTTVKGRFYWKGFLLQDQ